MRNFLKIITLMLVTVLLSSCGQSRTQHTYFAMDTVITITVNGSADKSVFDECERITADIENDISKTRTDSYIYKLNNTAEPIELPDHITDLINYSFSISNETGGAFDMTLEPVIRLWNLKSEAFVPPAEEIVLLNLKYCGADKFSVDGNKISKRSAEAGIDLGGVGKGYALQKVTEYLGSQGLNGTVSFGGNIGVFGQKDNGEPWNIGIKDPFDTSKMSGSLKMHSGYLAVSGAYERFAEYDGKIYHHIIDPSTGRPSDSDIASVAVLTANGALSDALSTALFVLGKDGAIELYETTDKSFEAVIVTNDGETIITEGIKKNDIFTQYNKKAE